MEGTAKSLGEVSSTLSRHTATQEDFLSPGAQGQFGQQSEKG